jgi:hypothetical protein
MMKRIIETRLRHIKSCDRSRKVQWIYCTLRNISMSSELETKQNPGLVFTMALCINADCFQGGLWD